jgi:hypothetical protein
MNELRPRRKEIEMSTTRFEGRRLIGYVNVEFEGESDGDGPEAHNQYIWTP